jgi:hypothetical protein
VISSTDLNRRLIPVLNDPAREHVADGGQRFELGGRRCIDINQPTASPSPTRPVPERRP